MRPHVAPEVDYFVDRHRLGKAFHRDFSLVPAHDAIFDQREGFIGNQDLTGIRQRLQPAGQVHFLADDGVVHTVFGTEVTYGGVAGADSRADLEWGFDALAAPSLAHDLHVITHFDGHGHAGESVFPLAAAGGVAEENHDGIADKLVDSATVLQGDFRHLIKVVVEDRKSVV